MLWDFKIGIEHYGMSVETDILRGYEFYYLGKQASMWISKMSIL